MKKNVWNSSRMENMMCMMCGIMCAVMPKMEHDRTLLLLE